MKLFDQTFYGDSDNRTWDLNIIFFNEIKLDIPCQRLGLPDEDTLQRLKNLEKKKIRLKRKLSFLEMM
jgi:hypothetical protein